VSPAIAPQLTEDDQVCSQIAIARNAALLGQNAVQVAQLAAPSKVPSAEEFAKMDPEAMRAAAEKLQRAAEQSAKLAAQILAMQQSQSARKPRGPSSTASKLQGGMQRTTILEDNVQESEYVGQPAPAGKERAPSSNMGGFFAAHATNLPVIQRVPETPEAAVGSAGSFQDNLSASTSIRYSSASGNYPAPLAGGHIPWGIVADGA